MPHILTFRHKPLPPRQHLYRKLLRSASIAIGMIGGALGLGMLGYHHYGAFTWNQSFYQAAMILAGEGPPREPDLPNLDAFRLFAGCYALFSGFTFVTIVGLMFGPVIQRFLHRFHLEIATGDGIVMPDPSDAPNKAPASATRGTPAP